MPAAGPDPLFAAFGAAVRALRMRRGLTQEALAERAQLHRTYLTDVELGRRNVSLYNVSRLAAALEVSMAELIGDAETLAARGDPTRGRGGCVVRPNGPAGRHG
jgi:transcriptional regulator with XRE-family HTH domain